jgi:5-amino-6-(5-phosphoribosylamino)uracil reductase
VLAEGGPTLNGQLALAGVIDELCLTLSPKLTAGSAKRIIAAPDLSTPTPLALHSVLEDDGYLFLRYQTGSICENTA